MKNFKMKSIISTLLIVSMICTSCKMFATQKMIDNIIPDHNTRMYTIADLLPYDYKEIKNARALYAMELQEFFSTNTTTESELKRDNEAKKNVFYKELMLRTHNYKIIKQRYNMYADQDGQISEVLTAERDNEYKGYYDITNAKSLSTIKKYNDGKADGVPLMSIRAIMDTATDSNANEMFTEVQCEIYKPVVIESNKYEKLKFGDKITLDIPATNSTAMCTKTNKVECTYIATDSLLYKDADGKDAYYFIADIDGKNKVRRVLDYYGKTIETYVETKPLQFMKYCRVTEANDQMRLLSSVINENLVEYNFSEIVERALCGGYLVYKYKDNVYGNYVTTNPKGYITSVVEFTNQRIDNAFYNKLNK